MTPRLEVDLHKDVSELSFPAFVALAASLRPESTERLLHLGSGTGRAVLAWTLMLPQAQACGVESDLVSYRIAAKARSHVGPSVQQRMFLHHGDMMDVQGDWCQANIILIS